MSAEDFIDQLESEMEPKVKKIMDRVGLTAKDMESIPMCSFEEFSARVNSMVSRKRVVKTKKMKKKSNHRGRHGIDRTEEA